MGSNTGVTFQVRISDYEEGIKWYEKLFSRKPDFVPHEDFAEGKSHKMHGFRLQKDSRQ
ncbi:hypothetical protein [Halobacillus amylolyticus]|uniref:Glyoxalase/fosfomycin resistance/dioxygenase domain-containing protein n=1 Tax=Halobacillus amylolyticus TaxID=2932259 RepID=A0ABY4HFQ8_9BACI|nr:hypothetical protein [Halobacillus amylolyticus]UOR13733.1 hypothetical protein MUO15_09980 [Halobacillus amylolyticus]